VASVVAFRRRGAPPVATVAAVTSWSTGKRIRGEAWSKEKFEGSAVELTEGGEKWRRRLRFLVGWRRRRRSEWIGGKRGWRGLGLAWGVTRMGEGAKRGATVMVAPFIGVARE
jgi:hypothetical protein